MNLWTDFNLILSDNDVLHGEGVDPETVRLRRPAIVKAASVALKKGSTRLHPAAMFTMFHVDEYRHARILFLGGKELASPFVARHLAGAKQVALVVCTIGPELEEYASSCMKEDPLVGLALDGLGNAAVEILSQQVCGRIGKQAQSIGLTASAPLSPGVREWPVEVGLPQIFSLLDPSRAGILLNSSGMMIPKKSISFVVGIGTEMVQTDLCALCNLRESCRFRHA